jgi:hypothetical protein
MGCRVGVRRVRPGVNSSEIRRNPGEIQRNSAKFSEIQREIQRNSSKFSEIQRNPANFGGFRRKDYGVFWTAAGKTCGITMESRPLIAMPKKNYRAPRRYEEEPRAVWPLTGEVPLCWPGGPCRSRCPCDSSDRPLTGACPQVRATFSGGQKSKPTYPAAGPRLHRNSVENQPSPPDA